MSPEGDAVAVYGELLERSRSLPYGMPTLANRLERMAEVQEEVVQHAAGVRPILHARLIPLLDEFLAIQRDLGGPAEKAVFAGLDRVSLVTRLLTRRPLAFLGGSDAYLLRCGAGGEGSFDTIGSPSERAPLRLNDLLCYDEMALSALVGMSVPTHFINAGARDNRGLAGPRESFERRGVYAGLVGARFERAERMEWRHMMVTPEQNTSCKGYGFEAEPGERDTRLLRAWARLYGREYLPLYAEAQADERGRYLDVGRGVLLDREIYARRLRMSIEPFLRDADDRARLAGVPAYVHVVGLGLGVWRVDPRQVEIMLEVYAQLLREIPLQHLSDLDFSWFGDASRCGGVASGEVFKGAGGAVRLHFSRRNPADRIEEGGKLLVAMYAWDSNAFPGNEYWMGSLAASGDPAAACCSNIPELQNPDVNSRVSGGCAWVFDEGGASAHALA